MWQIELDMEGVKSTATLLDEQAPKTCQAVWSRLPIEDLTIHVRWSGSAWRTEQNHRLEMDEAENPITRPDVGDLIYYRDPDHDLYKIALAYGPCQWRDSEGELPVTRIARLEDNREAFLEVCKHILFEGPKVIHIRRKT
jgi:hypothetical protein